jgi:antitoxin VapB
VNNWHDDWQNFPERAILDMASRRPLPMALSIKTDEADGLARSLARLTGETMTEAVTVALRERLEREQCKRQATPDIRARVAAMAESIRSAYDTRPVSKAEWDAASGDEPSVQR